MDLSSIAQLVSLAKDLLPALGAVWNGEPEEDSTQQSIRDIVKEKYSLLRDGVGASSMRILSHLEGCGSCEPSLLILEANPRAGKIAFTAREMLRDEFVYRLEFLKVLGVISAAGPTEYRISHLGKNFVREAKCRNDFPEIFS